MEEGCTLVSGVGDEVVLFVLFLITSVAIVLYLSSRSRRRDQRRPESTFEQDSVNQQQQQQQQEELGNEGGEGVVRQRQWGGEPHHTDESTTISSSDSTSDQTMLSIRLVSLHSTQTVVVSETTTLHQLQRSYFQNDVGERRRVRFIYQGRALTDLNASLLDNGIRNGSSLHIHVGEVETVVRHQENQDGANDTMLDLSGLFLPLLGVMLGIVWASFLLWPYVFSFPTKLMLFLLSVAYVFMFYNMRFS